jgi:hypothetical protein
VAESVFHTFKTEVIDLEDYDTHEAAKTAAVEYIAVFSHHQRCHSANGYLAPLRDEHPLNTRELLCPEKC